MNSDDLNRLLIRWIAGEDPDEGVAVVIYPFLLRVAARMADSASRRGYSLEADDMAQDLWLSILRAKNTGLLKGHPNPVAWIWVRSNFVLGHNTRSPLRKAMVDDMDFSRGWTCIPKRIRLVRRKTPRSARSRQGRWPGYGDSCRR